MLKKLTALQLYRVYRPAGCPLFPERCEPHERKGDWLGDHKVETSGLFSAQRDLPKGLPHSKPSSLGLRLCILSGPQFPPGRHLPGVVPEALHRQ